MCICVCCARAAASTKLAVNDEKEQRRHQPDRNWVQQNSVEHGTLRGAR